MAVKVLGRHYSHCGCQFCLVNFEDRYLMIPQPIHMKVIHKVDVPFRKRIGGRVRQIECHVCGKILNSENSTRVHMREEHGLANNEMEVLKQACEVCGKVFSVKQNLIYHINSAHLNIKPMPCDVCGERFGKHSSLIFHKLRHTGEKPFQCTVCFKSYRQRNDVIRHLARHVRDKEVDYETAHAVNTSTSKYVSKRYIYLKDSTIKGLQEVARSCSFPRRPRRVMRMKPKISNQAAGSSHDQVYEEVVLGETAVLMSELGEEYEKDDGIVRYVMAEDDGAEYIVQDDDGENVQYIIDNGDGSSFVLADDIADGKSVYVINDENGQNVRYVVESDSGAGEVEGYYDEKRQKIVLSEPKIEEETAEEDG